MKRAIINMQIIVHELKDHELREVVSKEVMKNNGVPQSTLVHFDGADEEEVLRKVREWIALTKI